MKDIFNLDVLFGFLIGFAAALVLMILPWMQKTGIEHYQELISGILALVGAAAAVVVVNRQIRQTQEIEDGRLAADREMKERQRYAARVMLPHALNSIWTYAQVSSNELRKVLNGQLPPKEDQRVLLPEEFTLPEIRSLQLELLQKAVEFSEKDIQDRIAELSNLLQIHESGIKNMSSLDREITSGRYYQMISDVVEICAVANDLYPYSRGGRVDIPDYPGADQMRSAAGWCGFRGGSWAPLFDFLERRWQSRFSLRRREGATLKDMQLS